MIFEALLLFGLLQAPMNVLPEPPVIEEVKSEWLCSCILGLQEWGVDVKGDAEDLKPNSKPIKGGVILLSYPKAEHAALILGFTDKGFRIRETNFFPCKESVRIIPYEDPAIRGFYK